MMKKSNKFKLVFLSILVLITLGLLFIYNNYKKQQDYKNTLLSQILEIEKQLDSSAVKLVSCWQYLVSDILTKNQNEKNELKVDCASLVYFGSWVMETPFYPELRNLKNELLKYKALVDKYTFGTLLSSELLDGGLRGNLENEILIQRTNIKEEILQIKNDNDIN